MQDSPDQSAQEDSEMKDTNLGQQEYLVYQLASKNGPPSNFIQLKI
jgi:hypothetical protein